VIYGSSWYNAAPGQSDLLHKSLIAGGAGLGVALYSQFWLILSQAHLDFKFLSVVRIAALLAMIVPAVGIAYLTGSPLMILWWGVLVGVGQLFIFIAHAKKKYGLGFEFGSAKFSRLSEMTGFAARTMLSLVISSGSSMIDKLLLGKLAQPADFTNYMVPTNVGMRLSAVSQSVMGPVFHNTSRAIGGSHTRSPAQIYDEMFELLFGWFVLLGVWITVWDEVALTIWLGPRLAANVEPLFAPIVVSYCLSGLANVSYSQLGAMNRLGIALRLQALMGLATAAFVYVGWRAGGITGVAYGILASRSLFLAQDILVIKAIQAHGWLSMGTWLHLGVQVSLGASLYALKRTFHLSFTAQAVCAVLHGAAVSLFLLRKNLPFGRKLHG
jgi:O-antigen/teichoic acid export membrane protein